MGDAKKFAAIRRLGGFRLEPIISSLIGAAESGDAAATNALFSALYTELHRLAKRELARRGTGKPECNHASHEARLRWLRIQSVNRVFALTLMLEIAEEITFIRHFLEVLRGWW
jgi:hypothetical protein